MGSPVRPGGFEAEGEVIDIDERSVRLPSARRGNLIEPEDGSGALSRDRIYCEKTVRGR